MPELTHKQVSSRGGKATKEKHPDHHSKIAKAKWEAWRKLHNKAEKGVDNNPLTATASTGII